MYSAGFLVLRVHVFRFLFNAKQQHTVCYIVCIINLTQYLWIILEIVLYTLDVQISLLFLIIGFTFVGFNLTFYGMSSESRL
jgi:hypothetical protein